MLIAKTLLVCSTLIPGDFGSAHRDDLTWIAIPVDASLETKHYAIFMEGTPEEVARRGELLEAAWNGYKKILGGAPKTKRTEKTIIRIFPTRAEWREGMNLEQEVPPEETLYLHYSPERKTVYLYETRSEYSTNKWMLYGSFQDFHRGVKSKNKALAREWFVTGMADVLSTHAWRGGELVLGSRLVLARNNRALDAIKYGVLPYIEDGEISIEDRNNWEVRWAMTAFLMFGSDGKYWPKFERLALGSTGSMLLGRDLLPSLGEPEEIIGEMVAWLNDEARVLQTTEDGIWEETGRSLTGRARGSWKHGIAFPDEKTNFLEAVVGVHNLDKHGFVVDWTKSDVFTAAVLHGEYLCVERFKNGRVELLHEARVKRGAQGRCAMSMERDGHDVIVRAAGAKPIRIPVTTRKFGLIVGQTDAEFEDISWR